MLKALKILGGVLLVFVLGGVLYLYSHYTTLIRNLVEENLPKVEQLASDKLGVPVKIGSVDVNQFLNQLDIFNLDRASDLTIHDIEIYDKQNELIARVDTAAVNFKLLALRDDPVAALDEIKIDGATLNLKQRDNDSWNVNDIKLESEGESTFDAKIFLTGGTINADFDGKNISVEEISAEADCADMNAVATKLSAKTLGAQIDATGTLGAAQQVINATADNIFFDKVLPYLPADKIPDGVEILGGTAENLSLHVLRRDDALTYTGSTKVKGASVKVETTDVEDINGNVTFNEREIILDASATANGQYASASGKVHLDTDETFFDIYAESDSFTPSAIISDIGIEGAAAVRAHLVGTASNPQVDADIYSSWLGYDNLSAQDISTKLRYVGDMIYLNDTDANIFGGNITGTAEIKTEDLSFNAHVKANGIDAATLCEFSGSDKIIDGKISMDIGINSNSSDTAQLKIYGNAGATDLDFEGLHVNDANASFYFTDDDLTIDYLSANLPNKGTIGVEGTITDTTDLNLNFYGAHIDLAILKRFNANLDVNGLSDFKGTIRGDADNPNVTLELTAIDNSKREGEHFAGQLFKQPFDSIQLAASGSLDGVNIDKFNLEKDGNLKWTVIEGSVGLTGEKRVNLQLDTTAVRAENIVELLMPELGLTGNISNTVKITGTIDNPQIVGNVKFKRGSLTQSDFKLLITEVEGDYFLEDNAIRLQDFKITSPLIDAIFNGEIKTPAPISSMIKDGTLNTELMTADFVVQGKDINLQRFKSKLPEKYNAEGHIAFEGIMKGTLARPIFDGELKAEEIFLNGVALTDVYGHVQYNDSNLYLEAFHFKDGDANCQVELIANLDNETMNGTADLTDGNIENFFKIFDVKDELLAGKLNSKILISGTFNKPQGSLTGEIPSGTFAGYDIHDIKVAVNLINDTIYFKQLEGKQGDAGTINLLGSANLNGPIDLKLIAKELDLGIFPKAAGLDIETSGTTNIAAELKGTFDNPFGSAIWTAKGSIAGATFDSLDGNFRFKNSLIDVVSLIVTREISDKTYSAKAEGFIPLKALFAKSKESLTDNEQLNLTLSLDDADLSLLPVMSKQIAWGIGNLQGAVKITGTAAHPQINGHISLNDGSVKVKGMKTLIEHINISTLFKGERFDIETFSSNIGGGTLTLTGGFSFPGLTPTNYNFDLVANNLNIDSDLYKGLFNANFNLSEGVIFRKTLPKVTGTINLDKCRVGIPDIPDDDSPLPDIILDVALNLGEKAHLYSSRLCDMYLIGNVNFQGTTLHPKTSGAINVKRGGTLTYLESVFNIREGEIHFNQIGSFLPTVRLIADTKIASTKVFLSVEGQPNNMDFRLTSSPEMTQEEILKLLTLREAYSKGGENNLTTADALAIGLQMTLLGDIEDALKRTLGIDQFTVSRGSGSMFERHSPAEQNNSNDKDYNLKIGKYVTDNLMIRYTRGFGSHKVNRYGIQYDFNDNIGLTIEREGKDYIFSIEARFKF